MKRKGIFLLTLLILLTSAGGAAPYDITVSDSLGSEPDAVPYAEKLFDLSFVHTVDIVLPDQDWNDLLQNPQNKTKYTADVTIDGRECEDVSFSAKGNSSLYLTQQQGSSRYSFKINFGKKEKGHTYLGLNKLSLSNGFSDATCMKDHLCYELFRALGVNAPLTSFGWVTVNGEDRGLYLLTEDMSESFLSRVYGGEGVLYKPEAEGYAINEDMVATGELIPSAPGARGADLLYIDDNPDSYPDIFKNAETKASDDDKLAVVAALKGLSGGNDLEQYLDTDEIIRYFAVHNFVLNYDSLTGPMLHNYYLYENFGKLSILPWDYNAAFGKFLTAIDPDHSDDATALVNSGIDSPLYMTTEDAVPIWRWIAENEEYRSQYHAVLDSLIREHIENGELINRIDMVSEMILPYVRKDPTAFFSEEQFLTACGMLKLFLKYRSESIRLQLDGALATENELQKGDSRIDASDIRMEEL